MRKEIDICNHVEMMIEKKNTLSKFVARQIEVYYVENAKLVVVDVQSNDWMESKGSFPLRPFLFFSGGFLSKRKKLWFVGIDIGLGSISYTSMLCALLPY